MTEILDQIDSGNKTIIIEKKHGVLRDQSVGWLWDTYETLKNEQTVKKVYG